MKKRFILFVFLCFSFLSTNYVCAQTESIKVITKGSKYKDHKDLAHRVFGIIGSNVCVSRFGTRYGSFGAPHHKLEILLYDTGTLKLKKTIKLDLRINKNDKKSSSPHFDYLYILRNSVIILSTREKKGVVTYYIRKYSFDFKPISEAKVIYEGEGWDKFSRINITSDNKKSFAFATTKDNGIHAVLISEDMNLLSEIEQIKKRKNYNWDEKSSLYILDNTTLGFISYGVKDGRFSYGLNLCDSKGNNDTYYFYFNDKSLHKPIITGYSDRTIGILSLFSLNGGKLHKGVYTAKLNRKSLKMEKEVFSNFTDENLNKNTVNTDNKFLKYSYTLKKAHTDKDGNITLTGEITYETYYYVTPQNSPTGVSEMKTVYNFDDVFIVKVSKDGEIIIHDVLRRKSKADTHGFFNELQEPIVLFADHKRNYKNGKSKKRRNPKTLIGGKSAKKINWVYTNIENNVIEQPQVFFTGKESKKYRFEFENYCKLNENTLIIMGRKRKINYRLYKLTFN